MSRMKKVVECSNYPLKKFTNNDFKQTLTDIVEFANNLPTNGIFNGNYTRRNPLDYGRLICNGSIQYWPKDIKSYIFGKQMVDIDQKNSHLVIIKWLLNRYCGTYDKFLDDYLINRDKALVDYSLCSKETLLKIINKSTISINHHSKVCDFHQKIYNPEHGLLKKMFVAFKSNKDRLLDDINKLITNKNRGDPNIDGKVFSMILQGYEDLILKNMIDYIEQDPELKVAILMFDGLLCYKSDKFNEKFLVEMEEYILEQTTIQVKLAYKSTETDWKPIPREIVECEIDAEASTCEVPRIENFNLKTLRTLCEEYWVYGKDGNHKNINWDCKKLVEYMNNYFCHFQTPPNYGFRNNVHDRYKYIKVQDMEHITLSTNISTKTYPVSHMYRKHIDILIYDEVDFYVNFHKGDVIDKVFEDSGLSRNLKIHNLYKRPFSLHSDTILEDAQEVFAYIHDIICDSDEKLYEFTLNWIAYILQYGKSGIALVLMGKKGVGKGVFKHLLEKLISEDYCYVDECASRLGSRFNSYEEGKLLGVYEEVLNNNGDKHARNELMKNKITDDKTMVESKGVDIRAMTNNCNYLFITNGQNPVKVEKDERRYVVATVSDKMMQNKVYFNRLNNVINKYRNELRDYFQNRPVCKSDMVVVETSGSKNLLYLNSSNIEDFIDFELDTHFEGGVDKLPTKELHNAFHTYCIENPDSRKVPNIKYFADYISTYSKYKKYIDKHGRSFVIKK